MEVQVMALAKLRKTKKIMFAASWTSIQTRKYTHTQIKKYSHKKKYDFTQEYVIFKEMTSTKLTQYHQCHVGIL
jgi:hypothetical protein